MEKTDKISSKELKKTGNRRVFLTSVAKSAAAGAVLAGTSYLGLDYAAKGMRNVVLDAEKEIRKLGLDVKALSGSLERKLVEEARQLKRHYSSGTLRIYEDLGIASPAEISEFEKIIKTSEEFERYYSFAERAREFKDRIDRRLLSLDEKLESYQPKTMQKLNDAIRSAFGKESGEQGKKQRTAIKQRLESLCRIYDANEDNKKAEVEVLKKINEYLEKTPDLLPEEREMLEFLKGKYQTGECEDELKNFIRNYNNYGERNEALMKLRASLSEAETLYGDIRQNKQYITKLQDLLKQGIELKERIKDISAGEFDAHKKQIEQRMFGLRTGVDEVIAELRKKGYDIETREEAVNKGMFSRSIEGLLKPLVFAGSLTAGALGFAGTYFLERKTMQKRAAESALKRAVALQNTLADKFDILARDYDSLSAENYKNSQFHGLGEGNDIY